MLAVRSFSSLVSLALTAGLLGVMILSLAARDGLSGENREATLHAFEVAETADASNQAMSRREPTRAKQSSETASRPRAKIPSELSLNTIDFEASVPFDGPVTSSPDGTAPDARKMGPHAAIATIAHPQPTEVSALPASPPRADTNAYSALVLAWLKRHQHFPEGQVRDALDATVLIAFTIDRRGRAGDVRVVRGSGIAWLDALALRQVRGASPFPRPAKSAPPGSLSFEIPMRYRARG